MSWHKPSSILVAGAGTRPPCECTRACTRAPRRPGAHRGYPYSTTTALTTVAPHDRPTTRFLEPHREEPPAKSGVLSRGVHGVFLDSTNPGCARYDLCQPSLSSASLRVSCDTR